MARVLVVDDEPDILLILRVNLEAVGHATALAADGEQALERVAAERFDVLLLDVMMPVMDGWAVLDALPRFPLRPRVVVLSAKTADADIARGLDAGAIDYITKPFTTEQVREAVARVSAYSDEEAEAFRRQRLSLVARH